jgi:phosphoglycolate phosphatase
MEKGIQRKRIMMTAPPIAFDLDGTLSDSSEGITRSINYALIELNRDPLPKKQLLHCIGPKITRIFEELLKDAVHSTIMEAVHFFRKRYREIGYRENRVYDGIPEMLETLKSMGHPLYVATSKRPDIAIQTARFLGLESYFKAVYGCGLQREKHEILNGVASENHLADGTAIMVGDRKFDISAGKTAGFRTIGVTWGFGDRQELEAAGAECIIDTVSSLPAAVKALSNAAP